MPPLCPFLPSSLLQINYALTANCHNCPDKIIEWAKTSCVDYQVGREEGKEGGKEGGRDVLGMNALVI